MEEQEIIKGCMVGDRVCQQLAYKKLYGKMMGVCMRYSKNKEEASDIMQDGFIKMFAKISKYEATGSFEGWVRRIMVNTALDNIRKNKKFIEHANSDYIEKNAEGLVEDEKDEQEDIDCSGISKENIMTEVQNLPTSCRTIFNMHVIDGIQHAEIAEQLGINIGTSKSQLFKAKMKLRKKLEKYSLVTT